MISLDLDKYIYKIKKNGVCELHGTNLIERKQNWTLLIFYWSILDKLRFTDIKYHFPTEDGDCAQPPWCLVLTDICSERDILVKILLICFSNWLKEKNYIWVFWYGKSKPNTNSEYTNIYSKPLNQPNLSPSYAKCLRFRQTLNFLYLTNEKDGGNI